MPVEGREELRELLEDLKQRVPGIELEFDALSRATIFVGADGLVELAKLLKEDKELSCNHLSCISAVDNQDHIAVIYHLFSYKNKWRIVIKVRISRDKPVIPSLVPVWLTADWHEREQYEMFGINFEGHPNLQRLLLAEDFPGFPLLKDFANENLEEYLLEDKRPDYLPLEGGEQ